MTRRRAVRRPFPLLRSVCALAWALAAAHAAACPDRLPDGLTAVSVGQDVVVDSVSMSMAQVQGSEAARTVIERTAQAWREAGYDVKSNSVGRWLVLSALDDKCMTTLQLGDQGPASGYLAIGKAATPTQARTRVTPPLPPGATVLSTVASSDDGRRGTMVVLSSGQSLEQLNAYYLRRLHDDKWAAVVSRVEADADRKLRRAVVSAQRGSQRIDVVIWREGGTHAVVNLADAL